MSPEQKNEFDVLCSQIDKKFGKGTMQSLTAEVSVDPDNIIPTGSVSLDTALGIGGYPKGRIIEIYGAESSGKSTLCLQAVANAQAQGKQCVYIDAEHTLDPIYASDIGCDITKLRVCQPDNGEQALEVVNMCARSGEVGLVIVDSVAALVPKAELEGEVTDSNVAGQARMMSKALRMITGNLNKTGCTIIFVNQIRMKIGVMFGCFHYDALVNFADGRSIPIGKVVDEQIKGNVYCLDEKTGQICEKPIIDWHDNGKVKDKEDFIHIKTSSIDNKGRFGLACTPDHKILTDKGWKKAKELSIENKLISKYTETINASYRDFMRGILIGDSHLSVRDKTTASLRLQDNNNIEYAIWKKEKLSNFLEMKELKISNGIRYDSIYSYELAKIKKDIGNRDPMYMLNDFSNLAFALWIMDDGHLDLENSHRRYGISIKRFKNNENKLTEIKEKLISLGLDCDFRKSDGYLQFTTKMTDKIAEMICRFVPESMQYKLPIEFKGKYQDFILNNHPVIKTDTVEIKEIRNASDRQMRNKRKFDISVFENHNYMIGGKNNGIIVHNSPKTTSGGNALKFYASQRLEIIRTGSEKEGDIVTGNKTLVKVVKNKTAPPFKTAEFIIRFGKGVDQTQEILDLAVEDRVIEKGGSWFRYKGESICQGKVAAREWLEENKEIREEIKKEIFELRGLI